MKLSERLTRILCHVPETETVADIGTDHGFLAIALLESGKVHRVVATDLREGPLLRAERHIDEAGLSERIECRLGNGLTVLSPGEAGAAVIAGMGGRTIREILSSEPEKTKTIPFLILSPQREEETVREWLSGNGYRITEEETVFEDGQYSPVIVASYTGLPETLSKPEMKYGPVLLRERPETFLRMLSFRESVLEEILSGMDKKRIPPEDPDRIRVSEELREIGNIIKAS